MKLNKTAIEAVASGRIPSAVVGTQKRFYRTQDGLQGTLNGYSVVTLKTDRKLVLRHHGFKSFAMRTAMNDFMEALGVNGKVSFAGGKFTVTICDREYQPTGDCLEVQL